MKSARYALEALLAYPLYGLFYILGLDAASALGGFIGRHIGPRLAASRKAKRHLQDALPGKTDKEYDHIIRAMWDNLGRVIAEYPHLRKIAENNVEIVNIDSAIRARDCGKSGIFFTGHLANWEIAPASTYVNIDLDSCSIYRKPNNPWLSDLLNNARSLKNALKTIPKSRSGTREFLRAVKNNEHIGILIDQKYNEGIPALFFGKPAMTSTAFADMGIKYGCPLVPFRIERLEKTRFRITFEEHIPTKDENGNDIPVEEVIAKAHSYLESWIADRPDQWIWLHKRWSEKAIALYNNKEDN